MYRWFTMVIQTRIAKPPTGPALLTLPVDVLKTAYVALSNPVPRCVLALTVTLGICGGLNTQPLKGGKAARSFCLAACACCFHLARVSSYRSQVHHTRPRRMNMMLTLTSRGNGTHLGLLYELGIVLRDQGRYHVAGVATGLDQPKPLSFYVLGASSSHKS